MLREAREGCRATERRTPEALRSWFLSFLIPIRQYFYTGSHLASGKPHKCSPVPHLQILPCWGQGTHTKDIGAVTDGSPLGKGEYCIGSRLTMRTLRVSPGKSFLAEQAIASSGNLEASGAQPVRDLVGPESVLLGLATPTASSSIILWKLEYGLWSHKAWVQLPDQPLIILEHATCFPTCKGD